MFWPIGAVLWSLACALAAQYVAWQKGRPLSEGFLLGVVLGPIGALVVALLPEKAPVLVEDDAPPSPPGVERPTMATRAPASEEVAVDPSTWRWR